MNTRTTGTAVARTVRSTKLHGPQRSLEALDRFNLTRSTESTRRQSKLYTPSLQTIQRHFADRLRPLALPAVLAERICTHKAFVGSSQENHNAKLAFIGRRAMHCHLATFYHRHRDLIPSTSEAFTDQGIDKALDTLRLGDTKGPGKALGLENVMRWREQVNSAGVPTGLWKARGACMEALMGAIFIQHGAAISLRFFQSHVLPYIHVPEPLQSVAKEFATPNPSSIDMLQRPPTSTQRQPELRRASAVG